MPVNTNNGYLDEEAIITMIKHTITHKIDSLDQNPDITIYDHFDTDELYEITTKLVNLIPLTSLQDVRLRLKIYQSGIDIWFNMINRWDINLMFNLMRQSNLTKMQMQTQYHKQIMDSYYQLLALFKLRQPNYNVDIVDLNDFKLKWPDVEWLDDNEYQRLLSAMYHDFSAYHNHSLVPFTTNNYSNEFWHAKLSYYVNQNHHSIEHAWLQNYLGNIINNEPDTISEQTDYFVTRLLDAFINWK